MFSDDGQESATSSADLAVSMPATATPSIAPILKGAPDSDGAEGNSSLAEDGNQSPPGGGEAKDHVPVAMSAVDRADVATDGDDLVAGILDWHDSPCAVQAAVAAAPVSTTVVAQVPLGPPDPFDIEIAAADPDDATPKVLLDKANEMESGAERLRKKTRGLSRKATCKRIAGYRKIRDGKCGFAPRPSSDIAMWEFEVLRHIGGGRSTLQLGIDIVNLLDEVRSLNGRVDPLVLGIPWRNLRDELNALLGRKKPPTRAKLREWSAKTIDQWLEYDDNRETTKAMTVGAFREFLDDGPVQPIVSVSKAATSVSGAIATEAPASDPGTVALLQLVKAGMLCDPLVLVEPLATDQGERARAHQALIAVVATLQAPVGVGENDDDAAEQLPEIPSNGTSKNRSPSKLVRRRRRSKWGMARTPGQPEWTKGDKLRTVEEMVALPVVEDAGPCTYYRNRRHKMTGFGSRSVRPGAAVYATGCKCGGRWHYILGSVYDDEELADLNLADKDAEEPADSPA